MVAAGGGGGGSSVARLASVSSRRGGVSTYRMRGGQAGRQAVRGQAQLGQEAGVRKPAPHATRLLATCPYCSATASVCVGGGGGGKEGRLDNKFRTASLQ